MYPLNSILVIVDPTRPAPQSAVDKAAALAVVSGARIELVICHAAATEQSEPSGSPHSKWRCEWQTLMSDLAQPLRARGIAVTTLAISGEPHHELLSYVAASKADLVVKGTHSHPLSSRIFSTTTDERLIEHCPIPLLLAKRRPWSAKCVVMSAIDPMGCPDAASHLDSAVLQLSSALVGWLKGELHIVHAYTPPAAHATRAAHFGEPAIDSVGEACAERESRLDVLKRFVVARGIRSQQLHADMGTAVSYIPRKASSLSADIVVLGASPPTQTGGRPAGKLTRRIFDALPCDVLLVRARYGT